MFFRDILHRHPRKAVAVLALGAAFLLTEVPTAEASPKPLGAATHASYKNTGAATETVIKTKVKRSRPKKAARKAARRPKRS